MKENRKSTKWIFVILVVVLLCLFLLSMCVGHYSISLHELVLLFRSFLDGSAVNDAAHTVLFESRIPRIIVAALIGCGLSVSGAAYQGVFRNPMVSPDILGASAGAGFGAALSLLLGIPQTGMQLIAFGCGLLSVMCALVLCRIIGPARGNSRLILILSGIVTGALFQAFISIIKYVADPFDTMPSIAFWLMGGLTYVTGDDIVLLLIPTAIGTAILMILRWKINLLAFGEEEALAMGIPVKRYRILIIACATLMTAAAVAIGGMIGWVGLIVPHFARLLTGPDYSRMLPCTAVLGAAFLLFVDDLARCIIPNDLPIGILTALVGAPVFALLLLKGKKGLL